MKVLIVEDDQIYREGMEWWLTEIGYEVVGSAANGASAMELLWQTHPDLVTMDGELEHKESGLAVARRIRKEDPKVIIVIISATEGLAFEGRSIYKGDIESLESLRGLLAAQLPLSSR